MRRKGFTIVELLVVIAIIMVLLSILLPAISRANHQARFVKCKSNMRQVLAAHASYAIDYKDAKPPLIAGPYVLVGFTSPNTRFATEFTGQGLLIPGRLRTLNTLLCPSTEMALDNARDLTMYGDGVTSFMSGSSYNYFYRGGPVDAFWTSPETFFAGITYTRAARKKEFALMIDVCFEGENKYTVGETEFGPRDWVAHEKLGRINIGFIDGSVKAVPAKEVMLKKPFGDKEVLDWFEKACKAY